MPVGRAWRKRNRLYRLLGLREFDRLHPGLGMRHRL
jgi:hypothetical protein